MANRAFEVFETAVFREWLQNQPERHVKRIVKRILRHAGGRVYYGDGKAVGAGVAELRFNTGHRIYYIQPQPHLLLLLRGGNKITQQGDIASSHADAKNGAAARSALPFSPERYLPVPSLDLTLANT